MLLILLKDNQKAIEMIDSFGKLDDAQIAFRGFGRGFFDIEDYENSRKYLPRFDPDTGGYVFQELDALCKILSLGMDTDSFIELLKFYERYRTGCEWIYTDHLRFRYGMVIWCYYINEKNIETASSRLDEIIQEQKNLTECKLWFPEPLLMAKHWLIQGENDKALSVYRMIESFQRKFEDVEIPMRLLNGTEVDINVEIAKCLNYEIM